MNDQPTLFDTGNNLVDSLFRRTCVLETEGRIEKKLSPRELQIMQLMADDFSYPQMAVHFKCSTQTIKRHVRRALVKLNCHSKVRAVGILVYKGDVTPHL